MSNLISQIEDLPIAYYQQNFNSSITNWLPFYWNGYFKSTIYTYILSCIDMKQFEAGFSRVIRYNIKQARPLAKVYETNEYGKLYVLICKTFERQEKKTP